MREPSSASEIPKLAAPGRAIPDNRQHILAFFLPLCLKPLWRSPETWRHVPSKIASFQLLASFGWGVLQDNSSTTGNSGGGTDYAP